MVTLRTFDHSAAAELAKSVLDANGIFCSLTDENAHLYLLAAVPIRLLVADNQVEEAARILDSLQGPPGESSDTSDDADQTA